MGVILEERHPLNQVLTVRGWTAEYCLRRVADRHKALGYGGMAIRKEKVSRWTRPGNPQTPNMPTQVAMAEVLGIDAREIRAQPWPHWLLLALRDDTAIWESPWNPAGTIQALDHAGGLVDLDRRGFLIATTATLAATLAQWATADPVPATASGGRQIGAAVADRFDSRLDDLRHLDDDLGSDHVYDAACAEKRLITRLLRDNSYSENTGRRLHASAAEASRLAGWCAFDSGQTAAAERHFVTSLRAAAGAGDRTAGATALAFWANLRYANSTPDPRGALDLLDGALTHRADITSPRVLTMLYIRQARAHSIAGEPTAAYRAIGNALAAYDRGTPPDEDLQSMYWITTGEVLQAAASAALSLGDPRRALTYFSSAVTHHDPYDSDKEPRGTAIYLARQAEAHLALGDLDGAVETGQQAVGLMGGVTSARGSETLNRLRTEFSRHRSTPVVRTFLDETG
ncbi:transcriptional regulator [Streptomyces lasiicapitis]|uniref:MFS transporter n=1 Tax=Streptomyces lasiicapitis TaxID=1923961 RepID=A0ABQ2MUM8_9ACTN|nr:transcriptional regulator [Streptomyces lasiicapitis]GGO58965.1 MFS transporter [Streptomyces lasiicapitis]